MDGAADLWVRWRVRVGYPVALLFAWLAKPSYWSLALGAVIGLIGLAVRAAAAGHLRKHEELAMSGPYAYTRNPLYLGSAGLAAGAIVAGHSWLAAVFVGAYFALFYSIVMRHEEAELRGKYGAAFEKYAECVPLFFPRLTRGTAARGQFSASQYLRNREYQAFLGFLAGLALLWAKMVWLG
jgi:protein-S-isoprenylcysteine O-methyltransferase Ste14